MSLPIYSMLIRKEQDVVAARQRARLIAELLGFEKVEQTRIATATSEIARNAFRYVGEGKIEFAFEDKGSPQKLIIRVADKGTGIQNLDEVLDGRYQSSTGMGMGLMGTRRLMDAFDIQTSAAGTTVIVAKDLPRGAGLVAGPHILRISDKLTQDKPTFAIEELDRQNQELLETLQLLEVKNERLDSLNQELEETNRGVVALYAELDEKAAQLRLADQIKSRFLSYMTHEFRTPVYSTLNLTRFLLDRTDGDLTVEQEKQVSLIRDSMQTLSTLVNDLLDLSKVESGKLTVDAEICTIDEIFSGLRGMFRPLMTNPRIQLSFESVNAIPILHTDEGKVSQILRNFISNALKFTEAGEICVQAFYDEGMLTVSVQDPGIGIPEENHELIFEEYSQIRNPLQRKSKGTGLGMPLSKKLAELLGGRVELKSQPGVGSTFYVVIPAKYRSIEVELQDEAVQLPAHMDHRERLFLIIDDEEASYYSLKKVLENEGDRVVVLNDPTLAVDYARNERPELIFLDLVMPEMYGADVLEDLKREEDTAHIPVIIHTSKMLSQFEQDKLKEHANDIIFKNMAMAELQRYIQSWHERR
jgi:signal transduction histidine kinase/CheY-like chemotaxis protein